jgi:hypothetical protein
MDSSGFEIMPIQQGVHSLKAVYKKLWNITFSNPTARSIPALQAPGADLEVI